MFTLIIHEFIYVSILKHIGKHTDMYCITHSVTDITSIHFS